MFYKSQSFKYTYLNTYVCGHTYVSYTLSQKISAQKTKQPTLMGVSLKGEKEPTERAPSGKSWNKLSKEIS